MLTYAAGSRLGHVARSFAVGGTRKKGPSAPRSVGGNLGQIGSSGYRYIIDKMSLIFLGTSSATPSPTRNVTSAALQLDGEVWLFDCGEGTQRQLQLSSVSQGSVTKVFVTHLHGDHVYGLPGLICGDSLRSAGTLHVYGPPGIREFIHSALRITITKYYPAKLARGVQVHELHALPAPRRGATIPFARAGVTLGYDLYLQEAPGTKQLSWRILSDAVTVEAAPIQHVVPCIGYVITEQMQHRVDPQKVKALGIKGPTIGQLQSGKSVVLEDGTQVQPEDVRGGIRQGRRVVILGDTCDPSNILRLDQIQTYWSTRRPTRAT